MSELVAPFITALLPLLVGGVATYRSRRHDRATALQELDILSRLDPESSEAGYVRDLVGRRLRTWWQKETSATGRHSLVTMTCLGALYALAVCSWALDYHTRTTHLALQQASERGDGPSAARIQLIVLELAGIADVVTALLVIVLGLGLVHTALWLARFLTDVRAWSRRPYAPPGVGLLVQHAETATDGKGTRSASPTQPHPAKDCRQPVQPVTRPHREAASTN